MDILVIDDDLIECSIIQQVLEHQDHKATFVPSAREAWKLISEDSFRFVIADASREEGSVRQLIQHARRDPNPPRHTYFLLLTQKGQSGNLISSPDVGVDDFLNKPVLPQELKSRVSLGVRILSIGDTLQQARDQLENLAVYDTLTGLMNRQAFYKVAEGELERARRASGGLSVIALDVDNFKAINSEHGQAVGDNVLRIVARIIREKSRPYDCIGRWGGDQFTIVLPGVVGTDAEKITKRILSGMRASEISLTDGSALDIKLSAGIASSHTINAYTEIEPFIQNAVVALKAARQNKDEKFSMVFL
jgi:diguanylate cyclase (GGDEF)-like protein